MTVRKVTNPTRKVTDPVLLSALSKQGVDYQYVESVQDYAPRSLGKGHSPYAKFYRDLKSGKRFMVASGLPMVKPDGQKIEVGWLYADGKYYSKANLFSAVVDGTKIRVTALSDQPSGTKANDYVEWQPQLFLKGKKQTCGDASLLDTDPTNPNYSQNTLEWDYKYVKRRLRIIEGRILEKWLSDYRGIHEIVHNPTGSISLKYGYATRADYKPIHVEVIGNREIVDTTNFPVSAFPVTIGASPETFYPDTGAAGVDGQAYITGQDSIWATIRGANGTGSNDSGTNGAANRIDGSTTNNQFAVLSRTLLLFPTSGLPDGCTPTATTLSLYGETLGSKRDELSCTPDVNIYACDPVSETALEAADFNIAKWGSIAFCDTPITYAAWKEGDGGDPETYRNDFAFNASGLAAISKTGVSKLGARNANYDVANHSPNWVSEGKSWISTWFSEKGAGYKPKLVVTYTILAPVVDGDLIGIGIIRKT